MVEKSKRVQKEFKKPSRTQQSFKAECDINKIMERFKKSTGAEYLNRYQGYLSGEFGDFSEVGDYRTALEQVERARGVFMALPAKVRSQLANDPAEFLDFVQNPANSQALIDMGLANPKQVQPEKVDDPVKLKDVR